MGIRNYSIRDNKYFRTTRFLIITFISEMIQVRRDLKSIENTFIDNESSHNYEVFNTK